MEAALQGKETLRLLADKRRSEEVFNLLGTGCGDNIFDIQNVFFSIINQIVAVVDD